MSALTWDRTGERYFEAGVSKGVLYVKKDSDRFSDIDEIAENIFDTTNFNNSVVNSVSMTILSYSYPSNNTVNLNISINTVYATYEGMTILLSNLVPNKKYAVRMQLQFNGIFQGYNQGVLGLKTSDLYSEDYGEVAIEFKRDNAPQSIWYEFVPNNSTCYLLFCIHGLIDNTTHSLSISNMAIYKQGNTNSSEYYPGVAWNGLSNVTISPGGFESTGMWADQEEYDEVRSAETMTGKIEAYTYPVAFSLCNGEEYLTRGVKIGQQQRKRFGICYRTEIGSDIEGINNGYLLHVIYDCAAILSDYDHQTVNDSPEVTMMSWDFIPYPTKMHGYSPFFEITFDSRNIPADKMSSLEDKLYGTALTPPTLLPPDELLAIVDTGEYDPFS